MRVSSSAASSYRSAGALGLSFALAGASPAFAEPPSVATSPVGSIVAHVDDAKRSKPEHLIVGSSVVLVIDASYSVDPDENKQMVEGIKAALRDEVSVNYGDCYALTVVYYADSAKLGKTHIVCNKDSMETFIAEELDYNPVVRPNLYHGVGSYTNISAGLYEAHNVFSCEKQVMNVYAMRRRVVLIGDGAVQRGAYNLQSELVTMASRFGVTSYAIPIVDHSGTHTVPAQQYYREQLVTPAGLTYIDKDIFGASPQPVQPGNYLPATNFSDVQRGVTLALSGPGF